MTDRELQLALDACRPGSRDLALPEFATLAERVAADPAVRREYEESQKFGADLQRDLHNIPVPAGLAERLLAALPANEMATSEAAAREPAAMAEAIAAAISAAQGAAPVATAVNVRPAPSFKLQQSRRKWLSLAAAACVAVVGIPLAYWGLSTPQLNHDQVVAGASEWFEQAWQDGEWNESVEAAPLAVYRVENAGVRADISGWQQVATRLDKRALLLQLQVGANGRAALAVMRTSRPIEGLATLPPWTPQINSGGRTVGVWQQDDRVYVLMVEGNPQLYRRLLPNNTIAAKLAALVKFAG